MLSLCLPLGAEFPPHCLLMSYQLSLTDYPLALDQGRALHLIHVSGCLVPRLAQSKDSIYNYGVNKLSSAFIVLSDQLVRVKRYSQWNCFIQVLY